MKPLCKTCKPPVWRVLILQPSGYPGDIRVKTHVNLVNPTGDSHTSRKLFLCSSMNQTSNLNIINILCTILLHKRSLKYEYELFQSLLYSLYLTCY